MDYKDVSKGVKTAEIDKIWLNFKILAASILSIIVSLIFHSFWIGFILFWVLSVRAAMKYYEFSKEKK